MDKKELMKLENIEKEYDAKYPLPIRAGFIAKEIYGEILEWLEYNAPEFVYNQFRDNWDIRKEV